MPATKKRTGPKKNISASMKKELVNHVATVASLLSARRGLASRAGQQFDGERDLYAVLGYKRNLDFDDYLAAYERGDIAARIVDAKPESTWRRNPIISNDSDPDNFTEFETAWAQLAQKHRVFHYLERVDKLAGIGQYGALLIGTDDVKDEKGMSKPMIKARRGADSLIYLTPFMEDSAEIERLDANPASPRFGLPELYRVTIASSTGGANTLTKKISVHWTRIIHVAEGLRENDYLGTPRLKPVFNRLWDVDKIAGGSAEIFWQAAKRIMVLQSKEGYAAVDDDDALTTMMEELIHGLRRVIDVQGYEVKTLDPSDVKPDEAFRVSLALISSATGIPQRILLGSEQGKMASTQDEVNWNGRVADRQKNFAEQVILRPFIDRLITVGILPKPQTEYTVTWPSLFELSDKEKAQIGLLKARTVAQYYGKAGENLPGVKLEDLIPMEEFRGEFLNLRSKKVESTKRKEAQGDNL